MKNYNLPKRDKNGYVMLDSYIDSLDEKILQNNRKANIYLDIDGNNFFFKEEGAKHYRFLPSLEKHKYSYANNDYYILNEIYISRLAQAMGIVSPTYFPARIGKYKGVICQDYNDLVDNPVELSQLLPSANDTNLKSIRKQRVLQEFTSNTLSDLEKISLFDCITLQKDRTGNNIIIGKSKEEDKDSVVAVDFASTAISFCKKKRFKVEDLNSRDLITFGVNRVFEDIDEYLLNVASSPYISTYTIEDFLSKIRECLVCGKFEEIHQEVVEEAIDCELNKSYKDTLEKTLYVMSDKINTAYDTRLSMGL